MRRSAIALALVLLVSVLQTAIPASAAPRIATLQVKGMVCQS
jgi:hypothetical protein